MGLTNYHKVRGKNMESRPSLNRELNKVQEKTNGVYGC